MNIEEPAKNLDVIVSVEMRNGRPMVTILAEKPLGVRLVEWYDGVTGADTEVTTKHFGRAFITDVSTGKFRSAPANIAEVIEEYPA